MANVFIIRPFLILIPEGRFGTAFIGVCQVSKGRRAKKQASKLSDTKQVNSFAVKHKRHAKIATVCLRRRRLTIYEKRLTANELSIPASQKG